MDISFIVVSNGKKREKTDLVLKSIHYQQIPNYEVIVVGDYPEGVGYGLLLDQNAANKGLLGVMRNKASQATKMPYICVLDDDMILSLDWYKNLLKYEGDFDILTSRVKLPDGTRFWDHACYQSPDKGHCLLEPEEDDDRLYMSGGQAWIMKREVADECKWNEKFSTGAERANMKSLKDYHEGKHNEDTDFALKCRESGFKIKHNHKMIAFHDDPQYTCVGRVVRIRKPNLPDGTPKPQHQNWVRGLNFYQPPESIAALVKDLFERGFLAEACDVARYGLQFHFQNMYIGQALKALEASHGGQLRGNNWTSENDPEYKQTLDFYIKLNLNFEVEDNGSS